VLRAAVEMRPDHAEASALLKQAQEKVSTRADVGRLIAQAREALGAKRAEDAQALLMKVLERDPGNAEAKSLARDVESERSRTVRADAVRQEARAAFEKEDWAQARTSWGVLLQMEPGDREGIEALKAIEEIEKEIRAAEAVAPLQAKVSEDLDALGAEVDESRDLLEPKLLDRIKDVVIRSRRAQASTDRRQIDGALSEIGSIRREIQTSVRKGVEARKELERIQEHRDRLASALETLGSEMEKLGDVLDEKTLGRARDLVLRSRRAESGADAKAIEASIREIASFRKELESAAGEAEKKRSEAQQIQALRDRISAELDALGGEVDEGREDLDKAILARVKDLVLRARRAEQSADRKEIEAVLAAVGAARSEVGHSLKRAEEARRERQKLIERRERIPAELDALGAEVDGARGSLDDAFLSQVRDAVLRGRKAEASEDPKEVEAALSRIESLRRGLKEALKRAADAALKRFEPALAAIREIPKEDHSIIGAPLMSKALAVVSGVEERHRNGDTAGINEKAGALDGLIQEIRGQQKAALARGAAAVKEASGPLESLLKSVEKNLKEATSRSAREALARAARDSAGPRLHVLQADVEALKRARQEIEKELQETLRHLREGVQKAWSALDANATKNRRAVAKDAELTKKLDRLKKESSAVGSADSLEALDRLQKEIAAVAIPFDPLRYLPHAIAAAVVVLAVGAFLGWRYVQSHTVHDYELKVVPWGRVVSITSENGTAVQPPSGDAPFHRLSLLPGRYSVQVENAATGGKETLNVTIPGDTSGQIKLSPPDYRRGVRQLVAGDPYFSEAP
jgi:DNA repair exonuclease SbcCD ATPase subunit